MVNRMLHYADNKKWVSAISYEPYKQEDSLITRLKLVVSGSIEINHNIIMNHRSSAFTNTYAMPNWIAPQNQLYMRIDIILELRVVMEIVYYVYTHICFCLYVQLNNRPHNSVLQ